MKDRNILIESEPEEYPHYFRGRTREKVKQGLADLAFTAENLDDEDIAAVFGVLSNSALEEETSYTKEPFTRETVVNALALFIQAIDLVGNQADTDLETVIRDATFEAYRRNRPRQVIGSVDVEVESTLRQQAHDRAYRKRRNGDLLSPSEMRALIDAEQPINEDTDKSQITEKQPQISILTHSEIGEYVVNNLEEIEPGLEVADSQLESPEDRSDSQILCVDQEGDAVFISWTNASLAPHRAKHFTDFIEHNSGPEQLRGILITPSAESEKARSQLVESGLEFRELQLGPHNVIKGINRPDVS